MKNGKQFFSVKNMQFLVLFSFFWGCLFLSDESRKPLIYNGDELTCTQTDNMNTFYTPKFLFNKGTYNINVDFGDISANISKIELWRQSEKLNEWEISSDMSTFSNNFSLPCDSQDVWFRIVSDNNQQSTIVNTKIKKLSITPKTFYYSDTYFMIALFLLTAIFLQFYFYKNKSKITQNQIIDFCLISGISFLCSFHLFTTAPYYGLDMPYHLARIEGIKDGILDGQFGVNILPNGTENYGYLNTLYPYLFLYIPALFRLCNVSLILSYKLFIFIINLATVVSVYISAKSITKSRLNIFLTVILYIFIPYRLGCMFGRAALGELIAEIFWPLIISGLYNIIIGEKKKWYFLAIGCSGMIQSHIISMLMTFFFCSLTFLVFIYRIFSEKRFLCFIKTAVFTLFLNIWYIVPFIFYYFNSKNNCTLDQLKITYYFEGTLNLSNLILLEQSDSILGIHIIVCIAICLLVLCIENISDNTSKNIFFSFLLFTGIFTAFSTTSYFPNRLLMQKGKIIPKIFINFQYPFRLLAPASFFIIFATLECLEKSLILKKYRKIISAMLIMCSLVPFLSISKNTEQYCYETPFTITTRAHKEKLTPKLFYPREYNNERIMQTYSKNLSMINSKYFYNYNAEDFYPYPVPSSPNNIVIRNFSKNGTKLKFDYTANSDDLTVELPLQWYSGYKAFNENRQPLTITKSNLGKIQVPLVGDGIEHRIFVQYGPIPLFTVANIISAISICCLITLLIYKKRNYTNKLDSKTLLIAEK